MKNQFMKTSLKVVVFFSLLFAGAMLISLFTSCSTDGRKWRNTQIMIQQPNEKGETYLLIKQGAGNWSKRVKSGSHGYAVNLEVYQKDGEDWYRLEYISEYRFHTVYFAGHYNFRELPNGDLIEDFDMPMEFETKTDYSFTATGRLKKADAYLLMLSEDMWD
jgi:hypothetical protein